MGLMTTVIIDEPVRLRPENRKRFSERDYLAYRQANPDLNVELTAEGEIRIVPPSGGESSYRSLDVAEHLSAWSRKDSQGKAFDSSVQFMLLDGSALSPDAAWVSNSSLSKLSWEERRQFLRLSPEFVIEVLSPSDRLKSAKSKMEKWVANGVKLGWLIDGDAEIVYVYQPDKPVQEKRGIRRLAGQGPVKRFTPNLRPIWQGLR